MRLAALLFPIFWAALATAHAIPEEIDESLDGYDHRLLVRGIIEMDLEDVQSKFGDEVDISLEGYDHELVARDVLAQGGVYGTAPSQNRDEFARKIPNLLDEHGQDVDLSLEGYDHDLVARSLESMQELEVGAMPDLANGEEAMETSDSTDSTHPVQTVYVRRVSELDTEGKGAELDASAMDQKVIADPASQLLVREIPSEGGAAARGLLDEEIDHASHGYDQNLVKRDIDEDASEPADIDYSLEGYHHDLIPHSMRTNLFKRSDSSETVDEASTVESRVVKGPPLKGTRGYFEDSAVTAKRWASSTSAFVRLWLGGRFV